MIYKTIFQYLSAVIGTSTCLGSGYWLTKKSLSQPKNESFIYLIVNAPESKDGLAFFRKSKKYYQCNFGDNLIDRSCEIFLLTRKQEESRKLKINDLSNNEKKLQETDQIISGNNYLIKVSKEKYEERKNKSSQISIETKAMEEKSEEIINLTIQEKFQSSIEEVTSNLAIIRNIKIVDSTWTTREENPEFFCEINEKQIPCSLKTFFSATNYVKYDSIEWSKLITVNKLDQLKLDAFYLLDLQKEKKLIKEFESSLIKVFVKNNDQKIHLINAKYEELLIGDVDLNKKILWLQKETNTHLVSAIIDQNNKPTKELISDNWKKNFKCKVIFEDTTSFIDESCNAYLFTFHETKNSSSLSNILNSHILLKEKAELLTNKFFKLTTFKNEKDLKAKEIVLLSKDEINNEGKEKVYATLNVKFSLSGKEFCGKTDMFIGKFKEQTQINGKNDLKCKFTGQSIKESCEIYNINDMNGTYPTPKAKIDITKSSKLNSTFLALIEQYYLIKFKEDKFDFLKNQKEVEIFNGDEKEKILTFNISVPVSGSVTEKTEDNFFLLTQNF